MQKGNFLRHDVRLGTSLKIDPRLVLASQLTQMSQVELESAIQTELAENPALERIGSEEEGLSNQEIREKVSLDERRESRDWETDRGLPDAGEEVDWVDLAVSHDSLSTHVRAQLISAVEPEFVLLAEIISESLDERGYLALSAEEIALQAGSSLADADYVISVLRQCEPAGVGADSVVGCLLLQLERDDSLEGRLAARMLKDHLDDFLHRNVRALARRFSVHPDVVLAAFEKTTALSPFPAEGFISGPVRPVMRHRANPEIKISHSTFGWEVTVNGIDPQMFQIAASYQAIAEKKGRAGKDASTRQHARHFTSRAERFIDAIRQRHETMMRLGHYLVQHQTGFVLTGQYKFLNDLTRTKLAQDLGVHESTISRATMDKFVEIATGEIISFDVFFDSSLKIKQMIAEILHSENPNNPLSDERIAAMLADQGVQIARRTVNKYRDKSKLLSSRRRKSA